MKRLLLLAALMFGFTPAAFAAPEILQLTPGNMLAQTHSHAAFFGVSGHFRKLSGTLRFDPATRQCTIDTVFVVKSLTAPLMVRGQVMSKDFLDPDRYPTMRFQGECKNNGSVLAGELTMHGQTHPFAMRVTNVYSDGRLIEFKTAGTLDRYEWGLDGLKMLVGKNLTVTDAVSLDGKPPLP